MKTTVNKPKRGSILVTLLFLVSILALLVATVANDSMQTLKTVSQSGRDTQAKYAAYAGMELVMNELRKQDRYIGEPIAAPDHGHRTGSLSELNRVSYNVLIWNNMSDSEGDGTTAREPIDGPTADIQVQPDTVYMMSTGSDTVRGEEVVLTSLAGTARRVRPVFEDAAYARTKMVLLDDTLIDAWDSGGGWNPYVGGDFPGSSGGGTGGSHGGGSAAGPASTVEDHEATLGTDSKSGRTLRLLEDSKLNGFFRIGPGVSGDAAFGDDSGTTTSSGGGLRGGGGSDGDSDSGSTTTSFAVATAAEVANIAGKEMDTEGYFEVDDKNTEMPRFVAPYESSDLLPPPTVNNPSSTREVAGPPGGPATVQQYVPPAPVELEPGGYESITVGDDQTLSLSPGVYYFSEEMNVSGKIELSGSDPTIVFVGKKAVFNNAKINKDGKTSSFQLCFTDELKDSEEVESLAASLADFFEIPEAASDGPTGPGAATTGGSSVQSYVASILSPIVDDTLPLDNPDRQEGASVLEINGGELFGSISGKNLVVKASGGDVYGGIMANVVKSNGTNIHQDLALKGSNLMNSGGWALEGVHQVR